MKIKPDFKLLLTLLLCATSTILSAADRKVTGTVKNAQSGDIVSGATIGVKGVQVFTLSDFDGNFTLLVPEYTTELIVTYPGMKDLQYSIPALGEVTAVILLEPGKNKGNIQKAAYGDTKISNSKKAHGAFFLNSHLKAPFGYGGSIGMLNKVGFTLDYTLYNNNWYEETNMIGASLLVRNGVYGKRKKAGFYTKIEGGYEFDGLGAYYFGIGEIFDFGWFHLTLSAGYGEYYEYDYTYYDYELYENYYVDDYTYWNDGIYIGFGLGFNFGK